MAKMKLPHDLRSAAESLNIRGLPAAEKEMILADLEKQSPGFSREAEADRIAKRGGAAGLFVQYLSSKTSAESDQLHSPAHKKLQTPSTK